MARYRYSHQQFAAEIAEVIAEVADVLEREGDHAAVRRLRQQSQDYLSDSTWTPDSFDGIVEELNGTGDRSLLRRLLGL